MNGSENRFIVTKCDERLQESTSNSNNINMNSSEMNDLTPSGSKKLFNKRSAKESKENGKPPLKRTGQEQGYDNHMFTVEESESEYSTLNSEQPFDIPNSDISAPRIPEKGWDTFTTLTPQELDDSLRGEWIYVFIVIFKILIYLLTFISVLIFAVISNSSLLLMTSMIRRQQKTVLCRKHLPNLNRDLDYGRTYVANYDISSFESIGWVWSLIVVMIAPQIISLYRCLKYCLFKNYKKPKIQTLFIVFLTESLSVIGYVLLVVMVLPNIDPGQGSKLAHSISLIPGIFAFISRIFKDNEHKKKTLISFDVISVLLQLFCAICWPLILLHEIKFSKERTLLTESQIWVIPIILIFISLGYWDNYLNIKKSKNLNKLMAFMREIRKDVNKSRYFTYALITIWKIILIFGTILAYFQINDFSRNRDVVERLFTNFTIAFSKHKINISRSATEFQSDEKIPTNYSDPSIYGWVILIQIGSTILCYAFSKFVCKIKIQIFSFTIPLTIVSPLTIVLVNILCRLRSRYVCELSDYLGLDYIYWYTPLAINDQIEIKDVLEAILWILSLVSQVWITSHIWEPKSEKLAKVENLFTKPEFSCVFIDQSLILNRKINIEKIKIRRLSREQLERTENEKVRIYMCATMWHENREEMTQMLKSVFRVDIDQSCRRQAKQFFNVTSDDYYECETHILFDDAFEERISDKTGGIGIGMGMGMVNSYVKTLIEEMDEAASCVHECQMRLKTPTLSTTPYGGQLVWTLPGQNKLYVHLKDKNKIRHKKRWSQVMYMYYLLGYRLKDKDPETRNKIADNTFILALDGDINFQPKAVRLLVDLMKKHDYLGGACGRIHPIGSGPMVWYQKFEYAIGHWLQKATEHVIGCVLCSPGCFSLFRARALMADNVMNKYTSKASEAIQYVQYDQGEDRWLCTLLLQQGWRIEYCAASDSYTHAPEGFGEFYNQRRRWAPSTLFNIWDLLSDFRRTVQINDNISTFYIIYQFALMVGSVLSPGCIFLMIVGAMNTSFNLRSELCILYSGAPILVFIFVCFYAKDSTQIKFAIILSIIYALLMLAVIVSTIIEMILETLLQPTAIFFIALCLTFLVAALIHPTECLCVLPLVLYMLCIPSMYLLLTIYSIINLNVVSWGTREGPTLPKRDHEENKPQENENQFTKYFNIKKLFKSKERSNLISCACCSNSAPLEDREVLKQEISELKSHLQEFNSILKISENTLFPNQTLNPLFRMNSKTYSDIEDNDKDISLQTNIKRNESVLEDIPLVSEDENQKSFWTKDKCFEFFSEQDLCQQESEFWRDFIDKYLLPLDRNPELEERVKFDLKELRDKIASAFGLLNSLFILLVLLLQLHEDVFKFTFEYKGVDIHFDIIGLFLVVFFGIILVIQFVGMLFHRFNTFSLLLAVTEINLCGGQTAVANTQQWLKENGVNIAKQLQKINSIEVNNKRKTVRYNRQELQPMKSVPIATEVTDLDEVFLKRVQSMKNNFDDEEILPESKLSKHRRNPTIKGIDVRKEIVRNVQRTMRRRRQVVSNVT